MKRDDDQKKLRKITRIYWFLLIYIVAALVWWLIALLQQASQMRDFQVLQLNATVDSTAAPLVYQREIDKIENQDYRTHTKYIGEGVIFLGFILFGALFVYRSIRRQIKLQHQQQHFMMAVTHELKTPIAITKLNLETLQKHKLEEQKQQKLLQATLIETERLNTLANNILISSQLEGGGYSYEKENIDVSALLEQTIATYRARFPGNTFNAEITPAIMLKGDNTLLQLLSSNLIENAVKYSPKNSSVTIQLTEDNQKVILSVIDTGPGIAEEEHAKVFEKFYRIGNENTRTAKGTGLGLFLCKKIARDHNATISIRNNRPAGCIFTVSFKPTTW